MKRSSKMLPLYIILALIFYVFCLVMLVNYSQYSMRAYDFFGINKLSSYFTFENNGGFDESDDYVIDADAADKTVANNVPDNTPLEDGAKADIAVNGDTAVEVHVNEADTSTTANKPDESEVSEKVTSEKNPDEAVTDENNTPENTAEEETASAPEAETEIERSGIEYSVEYTRALNREPDKIDFFTTDEDCDYRVLLKSKVSDNPLEGNIELTVYDERGIKISDARRFSPSYGNTSNYKDEFFTDYSLQKSKKHTLKISADNSAGDYKITFLKLERDAGVDKATAKLLNVGEEITATMNSTLADWYAYELDEGEYELSLHNIDVGGSLDVESVDDDDSYLFSQLLYNEDSLYRSISIRNPRKVYIKIENYGKKNVDGTYIINLTRVGE